MSGTSLTLFVPYGPPVLCRQQPPAPCYDLVAIERTAPAAPDRSRLAAAHLYAATQARRCAPVARPTRGRMVDLVG